MFGRLKCWQTKSNHIMDIQFRFEYMPITTQVYDRRLNKIYYCLTVISKQIYFRKYCRIGVEIIFFELSFYPYMLPEPVPNEFCVAALVHFVYSC